MTLPVRRNGCAHRASHQAEQPLGSSGTGTSTTSSSLLLDFRRRALVLVAELDEEGRES